MRFYEIEPDDRERLKQRQQQRKARVKTQFADPPAATDIKFADPMSKGELSTGAQTGTSAATAELPGQTKTRQQSQTVGADMPQGSADVMRQFMQQVGDVTDPVDVPAHDTPTDTPIGAPDPQEPTTLPATVSKALSMDGPTIDISWHELRNLPGYAIEKIRGAFRPLFQSIMDAELEDIKVSTTLDPSMGRDEMKELIGHLAHHGTKLDDFDLEAFGIDPEQYKVEKAYVYYLNGYNFLMIQEKLMGDRNWYVYSAPAKSSPYIGQDEPDQITSQ